MARKSQRRKPESDSEAVATPETYGECYKMLMHKLAAASHNPNPQPTVKVLLCFPNREASTLERPPCRGYDFGALEQSILVLG